MLMCEYISLTQSQIMMNSKTEEDDVKEDEDGEDEVVFHCDFT